MTSAYWRAALACLGIALAISAPLAAQGAGSVDMRIEIIPATTGVLPGTELVYPVRLFNYTSIPATSIEAEITLPPDVEFISLQTFRPDLVCVGPPVGSSGIVRCTKPSLPNFSFTGLEIRVRVPSTMATGTALRCVGEISAAQAELVPSDNWFVAVQYVKTGLEVSDLGLSASASPEPALPGQTITFSMPVTNAGPDDAYGIEYIGYLSRDMTFVSFEPPDDARCFVIGISVTPPIWLPGMHCFIPVLRAGETKVLRTSWSLPTVFPSGVELRGFVSAESAETGPLPNSTITPVRLGTGSGIPVPTLSLWMLALLALLTVVVAIQQRNGPQ